jgi:hypothetical protein
MMSNVKMSVGKLSAARVDPSMACGGATEAGSAGLPALFMGKAVRQSPAP